ncbi:hypothetical protein FHX09_000573 [Rhizobium sp. BK538]|nr:hypothetical protein [Rhizobium sp. BK538]
MAQAQVTPRLNNSRFTNGPSDGLFLQVNAVSHDASAST